jgi:ABC-type sugar transport system ATPase subunit
VIESEHPNPKVAVDPTTPLTEVLSVRGVVKRFGGVHALDDVDLELASGEIHAVVGENGAGKSTLMKVIAGLVAPDAGSVEIAGQAIEPTPAAAQAAGVALVHQELSLVPSLSVAENIYLGHLPRSLRVLRRARMNSAAAATLQSLDVDLDVEEIVERLSLAQRQFVEIAKALRLNPRILILDEPTATLTLPETEDLIALVKRLAEKGTAVVFVSHRIPEVFELCTSATVLRDGKRVKRVELASSSPDQIVRLMVGRDLEEDLAVAARNRPSGGYAPCLKISELVAPKVHSVSLEVGVGEIVGIGGLVGSGRTEFLRAAVGLDPRLGGTCELKRNGKAVRLRDYRHAIANGVAFVPEERRIDGLALDVSIAENIALPSVGDLSRHGLLRRRDVNRIGREAVTRLGIRSLSPDVPAGSLSGGNQQKVVLGKWLMRDVEALILDEPTRGVDVGAKAEVHRLIRDVADQGAAVLLVSSDLPELLSLADRIVVMRDGAVTGVLTREEASEQAVIGLATITKDHS